MQIHELNNFAGNLNSAYFAVDDGADTGKVTRQQIVKEVSDDIALANARIDSIVSGVTDGSEVIDARVGANGKTYTSLGAAIRGQVDDLNVEIFGSANSKLINTFFEANPVYESGAHENIVSLKDQAESDYSSFISYTPFGFIQLTNDFNKNYWFDTPFVSGKKYRVYAHYFGETNQYGNSNIRVFRGSTVLKNMNSVGEQNESYEFISDGTEKLRVAVSDATVFKLYSLVAIEVKSAFSSQFTSALNNVIGSSMKYGGHINSSNYAEKLPDLNDAPVNTFFTVYTGSTIDIPANVPVSNIAPFIVETFGTNGYIVYQKVTQYTNVSSLGGAFPVSGTSWTRCLVGNPGNRSVFYNWISVDDIQNTQIKGITNQIRPVVTVDKSAAADEPNLLFNNFYKAMKYAYNNYCDVRVKAGTYDIVDEYIAVEGQATFDAINNTWVGTPIGHGMAVRCDAEAYFTNNITAAKSANYLTVGRWFSPILPLDGGFRLEGFNCKAVNSRYVLHDGGYNNSGEFCNHEIINCQMELDNTELGVFKQCIGGGLLSGGVHVIIKGCIFNAVGLADGSGTVTYHNVSDTAPGADSYNTYDVSDNYFITGTVSCRKHGTETPVSPFRVHGNLLRAVPQISYEDPADNVDNMELLAWGNTITPSGN